MTGRLSEKIEKKIEARRKVNKGWFIPMDRLYRQYGVERESFHNRKFSGEPLKVLTKNAIGIFNDAKEILHQHKRSDVEDIVIEKICNETGSTLFAMHEMFSQLIISSPTQADVEIAKEKVSKFIVMYRDLKKDILPPKGHTTEDHAIDQYVQRMDDGGLPVVIEQFVEKNHQIGGRLDNQTLGIAESSITPNAADSKIALALVTPTVTTVKTDNGVRIFRHLKSSGDDGMEGSL
mmetsp:Transcript_11491/g.19916  ORF Transcript_11491/g.19916 Transcript_11491/m.19916 type:complete len:235 (-) Transcript_11491:19-723(-)